VTFLEVLPAAFEGGERIRRALWSQQVMVVVHDKQLCINWSNGALSHLWYPLIVTEGDYFADDWEVVG